MTRPPPHLPAQTHSTCVRSASPAEHGARSAQGGPRSVQTALSSVPGARRRLLDRSLQNSTLPLLSSSFRNSLPADLGAQPGPLRRAAPHIPEHRVCRRPLPLRLAVPLGRALSVCAPLRLLHFLGLLRRCLLLADEDLPSPIRDFNPPREAPQPRGFGLVDRVGRAALTPNLINLL